MIFTRVLIAFSFLIIVGCNQPQAPSTEQPVESSSQREQFTVVELSPAYEGGMKALFQYVAEEIKYPLNARSSGIEGTVAASFIIERDSKISHVKIESGINPACDNEVLRVIKQATGFRAGQQRGRTVRTQMSLPISFKIQQGKINADGSPQGAVIVGELAVKPFPLTVNASHGNGAWSGTVSDPEGNPMPGCSIVLEGTSFGTVSNRQGAFEIEATADQTLHISFVGAESKRVSQ